jgi:hypothetical protein
MKTSFLALALAGALSIGCRGEAPPVSPTPSPELESMIDQQAESAAPGSEKVGALFRGVAYDRGEFEEFRVEVEAGQCYYFVAAGDPTIEVFQLSVWDGKSKRPVEDEKAKGREALVKFCPKETGVSRFRGKVGRGAGHFAIGVFKKVAPQEQAEPVDQGMDLEKVINDEAASVAPGSTLVNMYTTKTCGSGSAGKCEEHDFYVQLERGTCYWFIGAAQKHVDDFYIYLWDPKNKRVGENKAKANKAQFGHCATDSGMFHVQAKLDDATKPAKVGVFAQKQKGQSAPAPKSEPDKAAKVDLEKVIKDEAGAAAPQAKLVGNHYTATSKKNEFFVQLEKGQCYWIIGASQPGADDFALYLWDPDNKRIGEAKDLKQKGQLGHCPKEGGMFKIQVKLDDAKDEVKIGIFGKAR